MQFLIHTSGKTLETCDKVYVVNAMSEAEAKQKAIKSFENEFGVVTESIITQPFKRIKRAIWAYIFMIIPILLSFINWKIGHDTLRIAPDLVSCLYSVGIYAAFVVRFKGIQRIIESWIDIIFSVLIILLFSTFIQTILFDKTINLFWMDQFKIDTKIILPIAIILSWLGLKFVSLICMAGVGVLSLFNITVLSSAMGNVWGTLYIISSFLGIILYLSIEPVTMEAKLHFKKSMMRAIDYTKNDGDCVKSSMKKHNVFSQKKELGQLEETQQKTSDK